MFEINVENWEGAACVSADPELFFDSHYKAIHEAKKICNTCPLIIKCAEYAIKNEQEWGVWGGLSADDRRLLTRKKQAKTRKGIPNKKAK